MLWRPTFPRLPIRLRGDIRALASKKDFTYAAVGKDIVACKRVHRYEGGLHKGEEVRGVSDQVQGRMQVWLKA